MVNLSEYKHSTWAILHTKAFFGGLERGGSDEAFEISQEYDRRRGWPRDR